MYSNYSVNMLPCKLPGFFQPSETLLNEIKETEANGIYLLIVNVSLRSIGSEIRFIPRSGGHLSKHEFNQAARFTGLQLHLSAAVYFFSVQSVFLKPQISLSSLRGFV